MSEGIIYLKDTGYENPNENGVRSYRVNNGNPIRLYLTDYSINSQRNLREVTIYEGRYYFPKHISSELPKLNLTCMVSKEIYMQNIFLYNPITRTFTQEINPPITSIIALLEQFKQTKSHLDLYASDGSGLLPAFYRKESLYWLSLITTHNTTTTTPERHLNVMLEDYSTSKININRFNINLRFLVLL